MTNFIIDNSDHGDLERAITWQFDNAPHIIGIIDAIKSFYDQSTKDFFDGILAKVNITDADSVDDYGLALWGKILNVARPMLKYEVGTEDEYSEVMSSEFYRRILAARILLLEKTATVPDYIEYVKNIFGDRISVVDGEDMSLTFTLKDGEELTDEESAAITQFPDVVFAFPSGVRSSEHSDSLMFGFDGQQDSEDESDPQVGGFDESGMNWRLTPKGNWQ